VSIFQKKPIRIEAVLYEAGKTLDSKFVGDSHSIFIYNEDGSLSIKTLEGTMRAESGDWIIKGVMGEFYSCKPNVFAATYERIW